MSDRTRQIEIDTGVSKDFLESTLTQDVSTLEALYDLVDNSIDAARNDILQKDHQLDLYGLPSSYKGYVIEIIIDSDQVTVIDNCFGIKEETLKHKTLTTATRSNHPFGIGHFGLGLKRSLLKIGSNYSFDIDNSKQLFKANFSNASIGGFEGKVIADVFESKGKHNTTFKVTNIKEEIKFDLRNKRWLQTAIEGFLQRYAIYLEKGLAINITSNLENNSYSLSSKLPKIRDNGNFLPTSKTLNFDDVTVVIESGIHEEYTFPIEDNYSLKKNRTLTDSFDILYMQ